jgi:hypothetical protein
MHAREDERRAEARLARRGDEGFSLPMRLEVGGWRGLRITPSAPAQRHPPTPFRKLAIGAAFEGERSRPETIREPSVASIALHARLIPDAPDFSVPASRALPLTEVLTESAYAHAQNDMLLDDKVVALRRAGT